MPLEVEQSDAYHEAGHIVIGVVQGFRLKSACAVQTANMDPHCEWEDYGITKEEAEKDKALAEKFTRQHALMCIAAEFAEALVSDVNNPESILAIHRDYLDAELVRKNTGFDYFGLNGRERLRAQARVLVEQHKKAIELVAADLATGKVLTHDEVVALIKKSKE